MRLLFVHNLPHWDRRAGGGQRINHELAVQAALAGHDVTVLLLAADLAGAPPLPYRVLRVPESGHLTVDAVRVARAVRDAARGGVEVVYASAAEGGLIPRRLPAGVGLVATTQHPDPPRIPALSWAHPLRSARRARAYQQALLEAELLRRAHVVTVPSDWSRRALRERGYLRPDRPITILPNGVGALWFEPPTAAAPLPVELLLVGRMDAQKGVDVLLRALTLPALGEVTARLVGAGPALDDYRAEVERAGLGSRVALVGPLPHERIRAEMAAARLFVLPSRAESFGMAILEAMAAAMPVVTTAAGGIGEFARDGVNARVVPVDDPGALAGAIRALLDDAELGRRLGQEGRRTAERYRWEAIGERLLEEIALARELARPAAPPPVRRAGVAYRKATAALALRRARRARPRPRPSEPTRIAVTRFGLIGDLLLTDPLLAALAARHPDAALELIVSDMRVVPPWMRALPRVTVTALRARSDADRWARPRDAALNADLEALGARWREAPPDLLLFGDPLDTPVMTHLAARVAALAPDAWRAGLSESEGPPAFLDEPVRVAPATHELERMRALAAAAGAPSEPRLPRVPAGPAPALPPHDGPDLAVHAGGSREQKRWPLDAFARLLERVHARTGARVLLVGSAGEGTLGDLLDPGVPVVDLTGRTTLEELAGVLGAAAAFVGNDSFPFHLAAALGTPAVVLAGPSPARWTGYASAQVAAVREPVVCSPADGSECPVYTVCPHGACMRSIRVDSVLDAVVGALRAPAQPPDRPQRQGSTESISTRPSGPRPR